MEVLFPIALFVLLSVSIGYAGYKFYVRPSRYYEQIGTGPVSGFGDASPRERQPGVVVKLIEKVGQKVPISPQEASETRRYLLAAGYRSDRALPLYFGIRVIFFAVCVVAGFFLRDYVPLNQALKMAVLFVAGIIGFFLPVFGLEWLVSRRQETLRLALPDALDLMVVCVEAGLGLEQAILNVGNELSDTHKELSEELELISLEMQAGKSRQEALRNLGQRTGEDEIKKLVAVLIQTDRFGTSMADSLRTHSDFMRVRRRQRAEERANKVGVKLVFPIFFCILPAMLLVVAGPGILQIMQELFPMMREFGNRG